VPVVLFAEMPSGFSFVILGATFLIFALLW
jgi:hypothetical protein